ncbi:MAG: hypothetical protein M0T85_00695 [Dehalococcoidales bacterium]|nr:hypothetical protein [Dehalococcoidales bacterium]
MWPFSSKPKEITKTTRQYETEYRDWAEKQMANGTSRQAVCNQLLKMNLGFPKLKGLSKSDQLTVLTDSVNRSEASSHVHRELYGVMGDRNLTGKELEKAGRIDEAIALYEANLTDCFEGTHPYERLRILYTKRKDYDNAIRVCRMAKEILKGSQELREAWDTEIKKLEERKSR